MRLVFYIKKKQYHIIIYKQNNWKRHFFGTKHRQRFLSNTAFSFSGSDIGVQWLICSFLVVCSNFLYHTLCIRYHEDNCRLCIAEDQNGVFSSQSKSAKLWSDSLFSDFERTVVELGIGTSWHYKWNGWSLGKRTDFQFALSLFGSSNGTGAENISSVCSSKNRHDSCKEQMRTTSRRYRPTKQRNVG